MKQHSRLFISSILIIPFFIAFAIVNIWPLAGPYALAALLVFLVSICLRWKLLTAIVGGLASIPLALMFAFAIAPSSTFWQFVTFYVVLLILGITYMILLRRIPARYMMDRHLTAVRKILISISALIVGAGFGLIVSFLLPHSLPFSNISLVIALCVLSAAAEETILRGVLQKQATTMLTPRYAIALVVLVSSITAFALSAPFATLVFAILSLILSILYRYTNSIIITFCFNVTAKIAFALVVTQAFLQ